MKTHQRDFRLKYDARARRWVAWYKDHGFIIGPIGRKAVTEVAKTLVAEHRRSMIPHRQIMRMALRQIREAKPFTRWEILPPPITHTAKRLHRRGLAITQGHELLALGMMSEIDRSSYYVVPLDALKSARMGQKREPMMKRGDI